MARKLKLLSIDSYIGLGNTAKSLRNRLVHAFYENNEEKTRTAINRLLGPLDIFKHEMDREIFKYIPLIEDKNNLTAKIYYGEKPLSDLEAEDLQRMEGSLARYGIVVPKPDGEEE